VAALSAFVRDFRASEASWGVPPLACLARSLRVVAFAGDPSRAFDRLSDAGRQLMTCFSVALQGAGNRAKRGATLPVVNQLFKIYFRINTLRMCKNLIRSLEAPNATPLDSFPIGQRVTYRFYTGRLAVFDEDYAKADGARIARGWGGRCAVACARVRARVCGHVAACACAELCVCVCACV
jgi:hypothetical protein